MAAGNDRTNRANNKDDAEEVKPPKKPAVEEIDASDVADEGEDLEEAKRDTAQNTEAAIRQNGSASPIELAYLGVEQPYGPEAPPHALQARESIELKTKPLSAEDSKLLASGRQRFFEPGMDERARLVSLRDTFDALAATRGAASSQHIIREGRNLLGLSHYIKISDALTSVDGGRSLDPQKEAQAAQNIGQALGEIKRLAGASPRGNSAAELQSLLGGREGVDALMAGLSSKDPAERDKALQAISKAITGGAEWSADNVLTRAFHEKRQSYSAEQIGSVDPNLRFLATHPIIDVQGSAINPADLFETTLNSLQSNQIEARIGMQQHGFLDEDGNFQFDRGDKVVKPQTIAERVSSVTPFMLNPHLMLQDHSSLNLDRAQNGAELARRLLQPRQGNGDLLGSRFQRLDGRQSLLDLESSANPFASLTTRFLREERQVPPWLPAAESVRDLSNAGNLGEASRALEKLSDLAQSGDKHAQTSLAITLLSLSNGEKGLNLAQQSIEGREPIFNPDLSRLDASARERLRGLALNEFAASGLGLNLRLQNSSVESFMGDGRQDRLTLQRGVVGPTREVLTCLAVALAANPSSATEAQRASMQAILSATADTDNGAYAIMNVLGALGNQRNDALEQMLVSHLSGQRGDYFLDCVTPAAQQGRATALSILARTVAQEDMEPAKAERAFETFRQAAQNGKADAVVKALLEQHARYGDDGNALNCLGAIAQDGKITDVQKNQILSVLRKEIASGDPDTHESAVKGFMRLSANWTDADLRLLADNVCDTTVDGLRNVISTANPERAKQLSQLLIENLQAGTYVDIHTQAAAVTALGVMADFAPSSSAAAIKNAVNAQRFANDPNVDRLTMNGVHALMRLGGSRGAANENALDALREPGFRNTATLKLDQPNVRKELADFVTGAITRAEMSPEARAATFDSKLPASIQSILREHGIEASNVNALVEKARNNHDDETIRSVIDRIELYNALPPSLRAQALGGNQNGSGESQVALPEQMDLPTVFGQMSNGTLDKSENSILLDPIENTIRNAREEIARQRREVSDEFQTNETSIRDSLETLTHHTAKGITTWEHFKSNIWSSVRNDFINDQETKLNWYNHELGDRQKLNDSIKKLNATHEAFTVALDATEYQRLRNDGREGDADRLALSMLKEHGPALASLAPDIWKDLGMVKSSSGEAVLGTADGETIWQRLKRQEVGGSMEAPQLLIGKADGIEKGLEALSKIKTDGGIDAETRRSLALLGIDTDPRLASLKKTAGDLQTTLPDLDKLLRAGLQGTRGKEYVNDVRTKVGALNDAIQLMNKKDEFGNTPLQRARLNVEQLRAGLKGLDPASREEVQQRIDALEKMIDVCDPESQNGMNIKLLIEKVNSNDFSESGFFQWLQGDGIKTIVAVGAAVGAAVAVGFALATFGAGSPLAAAAVTVAVAASATLGGMAGYELAAEGLYWAGAGDRTGAQFFHAMRGGLVDGADGNARRLTYGDVAADYGWQFLKGFGISLATMGAGAALGRSLTAVKTAFSRAASAETQAMARIGARAAQLEGAAEKFGGQELKKRWMQRLGEEIRKNAPREFREELTEEGYEKSSEIALEHFVGDVNPALSVFASALIANRKGLGGFDLHPKAGGAIDLQLDANTNSLETMNGLRDQMLADGLEVDWNGQVDSPMTIKTPEGYTINVNPHQAGKAVVESDAAEGNLELLKHSRQQLDAPAVETDRKAARLGQLESSLTQPGNNLTAEERSARETEIEKLKQEILSDFKNEAATQLSRSTGLAPDAARAIVDGLNIQLKPYDAETTSAGNLDSAGDLTMFVGGDMPPGARPHKAFVHEFTHLLDTARYTALRTANPSGYINALVDSTVSNSFTGKTGIWDQPGAKSLSDMLYTRLRAGQNGLTDADVNFARETLSTYLRQSADQGRLPHTPSKKELADWMKDRGRVFPDSKHENELLSEMVREISHANRVLFESQLSPEAMQNPALQHMVAEIGNSQSSDQIVLNHMMRGISDSTTAMVDSSRYEFGSRYENRAMRLQARSTIVATQDGMPALTAQLSTAIKADPQFAALSAKLEPLMGGADPRGSRRAGVRQSEYFASAEGQADLSALRRNPSTRMVAEQISQNVRNRQEALSAQRFLTALDTIPARRAQLDVATGDATVSAQQEFQNTLQSLFVNGKSADMPELTRFLEHSGLATGDQILSAMTADSAAALAGHDNATVSRMVQTLELAGLSRAKITDALVNAGATSPALAARLDELTSMLPPPVEVRSGDQTIAEGWISTLDSLANVETLSRFNDAKTRESITDNLESTVAGWRPSGEQFDNLRLLQDGAEHAAKQEALWQSQGPDFAMEADSWTKLKNETSAGAQKVAAQLTPEIDSRAQQLQSSFAKSLAANNLPPTNIVLANQGNSTATGANTPPARYNPATGEIEVTPQLLLTASPSEISNLVNAEYQKALAHRVATEAAASTNLTLGQRDTVGRVNEMFAKQAAHRAKVEQLTRQAEMLNDNTRMLLNEPGVRSLMGRMSADGANIESILGVAPPPELGALLAKFQSARKRDGSIDSKKWTEANAREVSHLLFPSVYRAGLKMNNDLQRARIDRPPTAGELAYDKANFDNTMADTIATTQFELDYIGQMDQRMSLSQRFSWGTLDRTSMSALADFARSTGIVEIGAGAGEAARALRKLEIDVNAYDINANNVEANGYLAGQKAEGVEEGGIEQVAEVVNKGRTLLLSYPPDGDAMGANTLKAFTAAGGTKLAFVGDRNAPGFNHNNTGDSEFHQILDNEWVLKQVVDLPHLPTGFNVATSKLYLYERRGSTPPTSEANVDTAANLHRPITDSISDLHAAAEQQGLSPYLDNLSSAVSNLGTAERESNFVKEQQRYLEEVIALAKEGKLNEAQIDDIANRISKNLKDISGSADLEPYMRNFIRGQNAQSNMEAFDKLCSNIPNSYDLLRVKGDITFMSRSGWQMKTNADGKPVMRDGNIVLEHNGEMRVYSRDKSLMESKGWKAVPGENGDPITMKHDNVHAEVEVRQDELLASMMGGDAGGNNTCTSCVTAFLMNAAHPKGIAAAIADGSITTPRQLQGLTGSATSNVDLGKMSRWISQYAGMEQTAVSLKALGVSEIRQVTPEILTKAGPGLYVATSPFGVDAQGNGLGHTWVVSVDAGGNVKTLDVATGRLTNWDFQRLDTLARVEGAAADQAMRNLGLTETTDTSRLELLKESKLPDKPATKAWGIGQTIQLDPATGEPVDPSLRAWFKTAKERVPLDDDGMKMFTEALEQGKAKFTVLDRKALEALEVEQDIYSFESGNESNRRPYKNPNGSMKVPLQHADQYNPEADVEPALIVKGQVNGRDRYYVINGCKRIQVFGSESLNPDNKSIKVLIFEDAATFERVLTHDPRRGFSTATPFFFETDDD